MWSRYERCAYKQDGCFWPQGLVTVPYLNLRFVFDCLELSAHYSTSGLLQDRRVSTMPKSVLLRSIRQSTPAGHLLHSQLTHPIGTSIPNDAVKQIGLYLDRCGLIRHPMPIFIRLEQQNIALVPSPEFHGYLIVVSGRDDPIDPSIQRCCRDPRHWLQT
jgi:hypothetical protein